MPKKGTAERTVLHLIRPGGTLTALVATLAWSGLFSFHPALAESMVLVGRTFPTSQRSQQAGSQAGPNLRGSSGHYRLSIAVNSTPSRAWAVLTNYEAMAGLMPDIHSAKVLQRSGTAVELQQVYLAPYTFGRRIRATLKLQETPPHRLSYRLIQGDALRQLSGSWTITPTGSGILLSHHVMVDPEVPGFIRPLYDELSEANLRQSMRVLKRLMETP